MKMFPHDNPPRIIKAVCDTIDRGGVVVYPTDSGYALGCNALKSHAIERVCEIKGTDPRKSRFSIVCYEMGGISRYARFDNRVFKLMRRNMPGPFTFILEGSSQLPKIFRNRRTLGVRMPACAIAMEIVRNLGVPLMTASLPAADGEPWEYAANPELIHEVWGNSVDMVIDGGIVPRRETTVVDCTGDEPEITRQGAGEIEGL